MAQYVRASNHLLNFNQNQNVQYSTLQKSISSIGNEIP